MDSHQYCIKITLDAFVVISMMKNLCYDNNFVTCNWDPSSPVAEGTVTPSLGAAFLASILLPVL